MAEPMNDGVGASPVESLREFQEYQYLMLKVFAIHIAEQHGEPGMRLLDKGVEADGVYRGIYMRDHSTALTSSRGVLHLVENWDNADWEIPATDGSLVTEVSGSSLTLRLPEAPGREYLANALGDDVATHILDSFWPAMLRGIALGYDSEVTVAADRADVRPWSVTFTGAETLERAPRFTRVEDPQRLLELNRRTTGLNAGLQMYISKELVAAYDASGEETVRRAAYQFGADRGSVIRERILAQGRQPTMANFASKDGLQNRDPDEAVFVFRERTHLSDGAYYVDCTYCPLAEVWAAEGPEGLRVGYLFDASNHRGLFQSYNPSTEVRWTSVKSRGDRICRFRFTVPELLTPEDPTPEEFDAADAPYLPR